MKELEFHFTFARNPPVPPSNAKKSSKSSIELFTGAGGLALATHMAGFEHAGLFEWNSDACRTLRANAMACRVRGLGGWRNRVTQGDVRDFSFETYEGVDLVAGGPPCQPFSMGGKAQGMEDRRDMIPQFIRAVRQARPRAFIMENVRGLTRKAFSNYLSYTLLQLSYPEEGRKQGESWMDHLHRLQKLKTSSSHPDLAYNVCHEVLNAADFGVPQCRERIFIVGFRSDINATWCFPNATHSQDRLLHDQWVTGRYWESKGLPRPLRMSPMVEKRLSRLRRMEVPTLKPWTTIRQALEDLPEPFTDRDSDGGIFNHRFQGGARPYPGHTGSPYDLPSKTLKAGDHGVPGGENMIVFEDGSCRYLTTREAARVQTFPDTWHFEGPWTEAMRQLGNAVPVDLAKVVAKSVARTLERH